MTGYVWLRGSESHMSLTYLDADGEQQEIPLADVEAKCEDGVLVDSTQVRRA